MNNIRFSGRNLRFKFIFVVVIIYISIFFQFCNAPRNNPLDADNPDNNLGSITGVVQTFSIPFTGIPDASLYWSKANKLVKTDANGKFAIINIPKENGNLIIQKDGYKADTVIINWGTNQNISPQINLNSLPSLDSIAIFTTVINQFNPEQTFELNIHAKVRDRDNDIDSVKVFNNQLNLDKKLDFNITLSNFQISLSTIDLNVIDLEEVIGLDFNINVYDRFKNIYTIGSGKVTRVIKSSVLVDTPSNSDTVNSNPTLTWLRFKPGYAFKYTTEVYTNDFANSQLVTRQQEISSDSTSYFVSKVLQPGDYYWVLWVIDQFQNRARSKPTTFVVK